MNASTTLGDDKRTVVTIASVGALALAAMQIGWYYVANRAAMEESTRTVAKDVLFYGAILLLCAIAVVTTVTARGPWWRRTAVAVALAVAGATALSAIVRYLTGTHTAVNSAFLAAGPGVEVATGAIGVALYIGAAAVAGVIVGAVTRTIMRSRGGE